MSGKSGKPPGHKPEPMSWVWMAAIMAAIMLGPLIGWLLSN